MRGALTASPVRLQPSTEAVDLRHLPAYLVPLVPSGARSFRTKNNDHGLPSPAGRPRARGYGVQGPQCYMPPHHYGLAGLPALPPAHDPVRPTASIALTHSPAARPVLTCSGDRSRPLQPSLRFPAASTQTRSTLVKVVAVMWHLPSVITGCLLELSASQSGRNSSGACSLALGPAS